ncbi:MAG TPA: hypothetical protein VLS48_07705 [Anaerolineales bacterium]|nr:hypothetical protein [Anaerolineales bacterium]
MGFRCPVCGDPQGLQIAASLELPGDAQMDEISLQAVRCAACGFCGSAVYAESRRGALDDESWRHQGYGMAPEEFAWLQRSLLSCPNSVQRDCRCAAHRRFARQDTSGRWAGLSGLSLGLQFEVEHI